MIDKTYISTSEAAELMGISRIAVYKKIKKGQIEARKIGRNYVIDKKSLGSLYQDLLPKQKQKIEKAVDKVVEEYGETLKKLGSE